MINPARARVLGWALWDCGSAGLTAVVTTFVFSVYLTGTVGLGLPGDTSPTSWLGRGMAIAGLAVALFAPVTGVWVDSPQRRRPVLAILTATIVVLTASMSVIRADYHYLLPGLILLACTAACSELASVPYNAMLRQLSTPQNSGRVSGFGLFFAYCGSVVLLLIAYVGFISGDGDTRGLLGIPAADGLNFRAVMLLAAAWLAVMAVPVFFAVPRVENPLPVPRVGFLGAYRKLGQEIRSEWRRDHNVVYYLVASAVFRDGLAGVFAFGAVLGVGVYGISSADVLLFGISASVIAAIGAVIGGLLDDRIGSKPIILGSLVAMIAAGLSMMALSGPLAFWVCGLVLCLFIGPTQSSARTMMLRISADGKEGVAFGLYTTTGRAVSFLAPWLFSVFIDIFGTDRAGMGGLCLVLALGLAGMVAVRAPRVPAPV